MDICDVSRTYEVLTQKETGVNLNWIVDSLIACDSIGIHQQDHQNSQDIKNEVKGSIANGLRKRDIKSRNKFNHSAKNKQLIKNKEHDPVRLFDFSNMSLVALKTKSQTIECTPIKETLKDD